MFTKYRETKESVYRQDYIVEALSKISHNKCAYCECLLGEESKYLHVEHFLPKDDFPEYIIEWNNLLPSCGRCNQHKSTHNPLKSGTIVNPALHDPKDHFILKGFRLLEKHPVKDGTVAVLGLNDRQQMQNARYKVTATVQELIEPLLDDSIEYDLGVQRASIRRNAIVRRTKGILRNAQPESEYAATVATALMESSDFIQIVDILLRNSIWDLELDNLFWTCDMLSLT